MKNMLATAFLALPLLPSFATDDTEGKKVSLFDGKTLNGWTDAKGNPAKTGWIVEDGCIHRASKGGDLFAPGEYGDFIFEFEWKISPKGNSGIKYRYTRYGKMTNGPEYQILDDDGHPDGQKGAGKRKTACLYDIMKADTEGVVRAPGAWNQGRIVARESVVEHWLNGKKVLSYDTSTEVFRKALDGSKFASTGDYAKKSPGRIMLQDHSDPVWYRKLYVTALKK